MRVLGIHFFRSFDISSLGSSARLDRRRPPVFSLAVAVATLGVFAPISAWAESAPPFLLQWGTLGSANGQFDTPSGIAIDATGKLLVADRNNNRIEKFAANGSFVSAWGTLGSGNGQFDSPRDVAVDAAGNVYVADAQNDRIQKFNSNGVFLLQWGTTGNGPGQFRAPRAIAIDRNSRVYVAEDGFPEKRVQKFTSSGAYLGTWGTFGTGDGQFASPRGLAIDDSGYVYVSDTLNNRIEKFTASGAFVRTWGTEGSGPGQFSFPIGLRWWRTKLYAVDSQNHRVQVFDRNGGFLVEFGSRCRLSDGLGCVDPDGPGPLQLGDGEFNYPQGIALLPSGEVFVTDTENERVVKFGNTPTDVEREGPAAGIRCSLASANPTSAGTLLRIQLPARSSGRGDSYQVHARVFDVLGRLVRELPAGSFPPGEHLLAWDGATSSGSPAAPGVYVLRLSVEGAADQHLKLVRLQ